MRDESDRERQVSLLLGRSSSWLAAAMDAWAAEEQDKVTALAPLAVELAVKALLLRINPALLAPLERQHEASLINLSTAVDLVDPKLRTVGLSEAMSRAIAAAGEEPRVAKGRRDRIVACRNGSMHLGGVSPSLGRHVLTDCIAVLAWVLERLQSSPQEFFGDNLDDSLALVRAGQSEIEQTVLARISKHRRFYETFLSGVAEDAVEAIIENLEEGVLTAHLPVDENNPDVVAAHAACPSCKRLGAIYGLVEVDGDAEAEWDDGQIVFHGRWIITLTPETFACDVCRLRLWGAQDLEAAGLPHRPYEPMLKDLGEFDPAAYAGYGGYDGY